MSKFLEMTIKATPFVIAFGVGGILFGTWGYHNGSKEPTELAKQEGFNMGLEVGKSLMYYCGPERYVGAPLTVRCWKRTEVDTQ